MCRKSRAVCHESGYALLMVCFLAAVMIIATWAAVPNLLTESQREKEEETIWRGEQYARAVRLYFRKNGRFPQSVEDLVERKQTIRFLRKPYADPMNAKDGAWRFIYIGPNGQLIGSLKQGGLRAVGGAMFGGGPAPAPRLDDRPGSEQRAPVSTPRAVGPPPTEARPGEAGRVFGGNIIGVGSTINKRSIKVYKGGTTYREWEFIWDPTADQQQMGVPGGQPGQVRPGGTPRPPTSITPPRPPQ